MSLARPADIRSGMFISLKKYLDSRPEQVASAALRMIHLLLQGIEMHAVKGDAADYDRFREDIRKVHESLGERPSASEVLVLAGSTLKALEEYNKQTSKYLHIQCGELQAMIGMLTKTMTAIATGGETSTSRLQTIESQLHKATMIEEFQTAKLRMSECLDNLRGEIVRQREHSTRAVTELKEALEQSQERITPKPTRRRDPVTGLHERAEAEAAMLAAAQENRRVYAVILILERLNLVNSRFGYAVGDQLLLFFTQHLAQGLSGADKLFRWSGPALLALLERPESTAKVREQIARVVSQRLTKNIQVGNRSVLLPVAADWTIFSLLEIRPVQLLFQQIDAFVHRDSSSAEDRDAETA